METTLCFCRFSEHSTKCKSGLNYAKLFKIEKKNWHIWRTKSWVLEHLNRNMNFSSLLYIILGLLQCLKNSVKDEEIVKYFFLISYQNIAVDELSPAIDPRPLWADLALNLEDGDADVQWIKRVAHNKKWIRLTLNILFHL